MIMLSKEKCVEPISIMPFHLLSRSNETIMTEI